LNRPPSTAPFVSAVSPPPNQTGPTFHFCFRGGELLTRLVGEVVSVPNLDETPDASSLSEVRRHYLGHNAGAHYVAVELETDSPAPAGFEYSGLRELFGRLDDESMAMAGRAVQIVAWARTHQFCGQCGTPTEPRPAERALVCRSCGLLSFPRLSPAIIVRIERGNRLLLAHNHRFPKGRYSILAGFVEPGETLEEAVEREVEEEVGIQIRDIEYFASQSWPFPNSLMLGFTARYAGGEIRVEDEELSHADWFSVDNLPDLPPSISISRRLIDAFLERHGRESNDEG
jgi:NAD+ diphosphatase